MSFLSLRVFKDVIRHIEQAEYRWEDGEEFASGDDLVAEQEDHGNQERSSQEGGAPVGEESSLHHCGCFLMMWEER